MARDRRAANPVRHGLLARDAMLPWEQYSRYQELLRNLIEFHEPDGPTERHLVEELAGIMWRKRRLGPAERQVYLEAMLGDRDEPILEKYKDLKEDIKSDSRPNIRKLADNLHGPISQEFYSKTQARRLFKTKTAANLDPERLSSLARYEAHLDRKFQRLLSMLLVLQKDRIANGKAVPKKIDKNDW
jgi:hypothetical protein